MQHRIIIGGFGAAGAALALGLHQAGFDPQEIAIFEGANAAKHQNDARFIALNAASRTLLTKLDIWPQLEGEAYPMKRIALTDTALEADIRPPLLDFMQDSYEPEGEAGVLAHLVSLPKVTSALRQACQAASIPVYPHAIAHYETGLNSVTLTAGGQTHHAALLIAADGAQSPLRSLAGIPFYAAPYPQTALVATIRHSAPHGGEAVQHFLPAGTFALLPLDEYRSSLVWSEKPDVATQILCADPWMQKEEITRRAAGWRGEIEAVEALSSHPLSLGLARDFIAPRLALVADAAHIVHPLAGQGLNLGFGDVATLTDGIINHARLGLDVGDSVMLTAYQAARRPPAVAMAMATDGLNRLFSNDVMPIRILRDFGAGVINRLPEVKKRLMEVAGG